MCCCAAAAVCKSKVEGRYLSGQQCLRLSRLAESDRLARPARYCRSAVAMTTMGARSGDVCVCVCVQIEGGSFRTLGTCVFVCQATQVVPSLLMLQVAHCWCFGQVVRARWTLDTGSDKLQCTRIYFVCPTKHPEISRELQAQGSKNEKLRSSSSRSLLALRPRILRTFCSAPSQTSGWLTRLVHKPKPLAKLPKLNNGWQQ